MAADGHDTTAYPEWWCGPCWQLIEREATGDAEKSETVDVEVDGRQLRLSNLDKVLYPETGFTKGEVIDYYTRMAPVLLPHLAGRPLTVKRYPNGVDGAFFFEKNAPRGTPTGFAP